MCAYLRRNDAHPFLRADQEAMGTIFFILDHFAESPAGCLSRRGTMFIPLRSALGVTCPAPPMRAYMVRGPTSGPHPHPLTAQHPLGVRARPSTSVVCMYVSIPFGDPTPRTPEWPWSYPGSAHQAMSLISRLPCMRNAHERAVTQNQARLGRRTMVFVQICDSN